MLIDKNIKKLFLIVFLLFIFIFGFSINEVQAKTSDIGLNCQKVLTEECVPSPSNNNCSTFQSTLQKCLDYYENQEKVYGKNIASTRRKEKTLTNEIYILNNKIRQLNNEIYQTNLIIKNLNLKIHGTETSIDKTSEEIKSSKEKLANIIRTIYEEDNKTSLDLFFSQGKMSNFFSDLVDLELLGAKNQELLQSVENLQSYLKNQKDSLSKSKSDYQNMVALRQIQKEEGQSTQERQIKILKVTKGKEKLYKKYKSDVAKKANIIRSKIFSLSGVSSTEAPSFGDAIKIATYVGKRVNIRPAFLLAILSQESAIGRNVGNCYVTNTRTGGGIYASGSSAPRIMSPTRDLPVFLQLTAKLHLGYSKVPVSCWIPAYHHGRPIGWGGAMGPAQFIPSTWKLYEDKIKRYTGDPIPNPWSINDSFTASGLYLSDLGAWRQTSWAEMKAAAKYYGGKATSYTIKYYAAPVMKRAWCIQNFIDYGSMSSYCQNLILPKS